MGIIKKIKLALYRKSNERAIRAALVTQREELRIINEQIDRFIEVEGMESYIHWLHQERKEMFPVLKEDCGRSIGVRL